MYLKKDVYKKTLQYFNNDELAASVWMDKYALKDSDGEFLEQTPEDMHRRIARELTKQIKKNKYGHIVDYDEILGYLQNFGQIIPGGSVQSQLGNTNSFGSLSNCTVVPSPYDSYGGILNTDQMLAQLMKRRCGVGTDISPLRPRGFKVKNAARTSTGMSSFAKRFSNTTREVAQDGRRGALMLSVWIEHPDALEFIEMKSDLTQITGANISVQISDEFMNAVLRNEQFIQRFPVESEVPNDVINSFKNEKYNAVIIKDDIYFKKINAKELWNNLIKMSHKVAEPGIIFRDAHHFYSTSSVYEMYKNVTTNPCGEIMMGPYDSCRLIALNLFGFVDDPFTPQAKFNFKKWDRAVQIAQLINDAIVDLELTGIKKIIKKINSDSEPIEIKKSEIDLWKKFYEVGKNGRRTGLGFTALGDTLAALNILYGSKESDKMIEKIMKHKLSNEFKMSIEMAKINGPFVGWDPETEKKSTFIQMMEKEFPELYNEMMKYGRRNVSISTVAPTGSLSLLAGTTSGIEPAFALFYYRSKKITNNKDKADFIDANGDGWKQFKVYHHKLNTWSLINKTKPSNFKESPYFNATAPDIHWENRVRTQAIIQKYTTHSISSTINLDKDVKPSLISDIFKESWKLGIKGVTVYRDGSRDGVLNVNEKQTNEEVKIHAKRRPASIDANVYSFINEGEKWVGFIGMLDGRPYELFTGKSESFHIPSYVKIGKIVKSKPLDKDGNKHAKYDFIFTDKDGNENIVEYLNRSFKKEYDDFAKLISGFLRHNMPPHSLDILLGKINFDGEYIGTWKSGVRRMIRKFIKIDELNRGDKNKSALCPECGDPNGIVLEDGCLHCVSCGYSAC